MTAQSTKRLPEVRSMGHRFDDNLRCPCVVEWHRHQDKPGKCPVDAQRTVKEDE